MYLTVSITDFELENISLETIRYYQKNYAYPKLP